MVMLGGEKNRCDDECVLILFFSHVLDFGCHFVGCKESEEGHGDYFTLMNDTEIGIEDDMSRSLLWINRLRRLENDDTHSVWKSSPGTAQRPRLDRTWTD